MFLLGNPKPQTGNNRVLILDAEQIYNDQAKQDVRSRIRKICQSLANYKAAFDAAGVDGDKGISETMKRSIAEVFKQKSVPLGVVSVEVSNLKPDQSIVDALVQQAAAREQQKTIDGMAQFLQGNPARLAIYQIQVNREIAMAGIAKGNGFIYQVGGATSTIPIPVGGATAVTAQVEPPLKK